MSKSKVDTTAARLERERQILDTAYRLGRVCHDERPTREAQLDRRCMESLALSGHLRRVARGIYRITPGTGLYRLRELEADIARSGVRRVPRSASACSVRHHLVARRSTA